MSDISKCSGTDCAMKTNCYRYTAPDSYHQSYFSQPPLDETGKCDYYWPVETKPKSNSQAKRLDMQTRRKTGTHE